MTRTEQKMLDRRDADAACLREVLSATQDEVLLQHRPRSAKVWPSWEFLRDGQIVPTNPFAYRVLTETVAGC